MSAADLAKVPAFAMMMMAERFAWKPPYKYTPKKEELTKYGRADFVTRTVRWFPIPTLGIPYVFHLCEAAAIIARECPSPLSDRILSKLFKDPLAVNRVKISPAFVIGFLLLIGGGSLRKACFDTLGKFFTFELAVLKEHRLVTSGPYALVRHPSYTAFLLANAGLMLVQFFPGSYVYESGILRSRWAAGVLGLWTLWVGYTAQTLVRRAPKEDVVLKKEFDSQWDEWAKRTPYRLIPYIY